MRDGPGEIRNRSCIEAKGRPEAIGVLSGLLRDVEEWIFVFRDGIAALIPDVSESDIRRIGAFDDFGVDRGRS